MDALDRPHQFRELLPVSMTEERGSLCLAGIPLADLAEMYGTPLYVYDEASIRAAVGEVRTAFRPMRARISFAAKACALVGVLALVREEGLALDVVSAGEIEAGLRAGFGAGQMHLHGNCKSDEDLRPALRLGIHAIVADSLHELHRLEELATEPITIWLRLALPIQAATHPHLQTGGGSKFGIEPGPDLDAAIARIAGSRLLELRGLHTHLGSQIADSTLFQQAANNLAIQGEALRSQGVEVRSISVGGGWAVPYSPGEARLPPDRVAAALAAVADEHADLEIAVEPGRALIARTAVALYRVGAVKESAGRRIVAVDGGMGDNPRPALYGSAYSALPVARPSREPVGLADVAGRYCESGDVLARGVPLSEVMPGDLLCIPVAGAYQLSMASAYNLVPPPAAVMAGPMGARPLLRRATVDDLLKRDQWPIASPEKR